MHNSNIPLDKELPSTKQLVRSTIIAATAAAAILVTIVMPAEYGIDPTGVGKILGLQKMGEIKMSLAKDIAAEEAKELANNSSASNIQPLKEVATTPDISKNLTHEMQITLTPNEGKEIKATMIKGTKLKYTWWTNKGRANFDTHGDSAELDIDYHNYEKGSKQHSEGVLEAAFNGEHGWFWRNRTSETITVTLQTKGEYTSIKLMK